MRKSILFLIITTIACSLYCEELIDIYMANFDKAKLDAKLQVLQDCIAKKIEGSGPLFNYALYFIINNYKSVREQYPSKEMAYLAVNQVNTLNYKPARTALWELFLLDTNTRVRVDIFAALARLASDDSEIIRKINIWFLSQHDLFNFSKTPDLQVASACIKALGTIGDPSSFPALLLVSYAGYPETHRKQAEEAIKSIRGDLRDLYINMINTHKLIDKKYALERALADTKLSVSAKCEVSFAVLRNTVYEVIDTPDGRALSKELRNRAATYLGNNKWREAEEFAVGHFKRSLDEYESRIIGTTDFLPSIIVLGQIGSHNAAIALKGYLDSTNALFEEGRPYDEQVVLQVVSSLGNIGDKIARSSLLYIGYLKYSDKIKKAANEAFKAIK